MEATMLKAEPREEIQVAAASEGVLQAWLDAGFAPAERAAGAAFEVLHGVRSEVMERLGTALDEAENLQRGAYRIARMVRDRLGETAESTLRSGESAVLASIRALRQVSRDTARLAAGAASQNP
jgi:hypothetical protein